MRSAERHQRAIALSRASALFLSIVALGTSGFLFTQNLELREQIDALGQSSNVCGPAGAPGVDGSCGPVGAAGPCGPQGEQGIPGETGAQGEPGVDGAPGSDGAPGATGAQGEKGDTGETGPPGSDGVTTLGHHGAFFDGADQTFSGEPQAMRMNNASPDNCGVYLDEETSTKIYVSRDGVYNLQFSAQIRSDLNQTKEVDIWLAKNGVSVPNSNSQFFAPDRKGI